MNKFQVTIFLFTFLCKVVENANILAIVPSPLYSHQATFRPLWKALSKNGHNITLITTNPMPLHENITQIDLSGTYSILDKYKSEGVLFGDLNAWQIIRILPRVADEILKFQLSHMDLDRLKDPLKYHCDVIIAETSISVYYALSNKLNCPLILISSLDASPEYHDFVGNAVHPAIYSHADFLLGEKLSFFERLANTFISILLRIFFICSSGVLDTYVEEYFGKNISQIYDIHKSISLLIVNSNPIFHPLRPSTPITISTGGGLHFGEALPLPKDLQIYLDESTHGCIYFSFGSMVDSNFLTPKAMEIFRKTFEEIAPVRVLWKFENETMASKPENVELRKWIPQHDVLRHPNVKVFITQGGLHSMEEAIDTTVPMLGMPFYGDQINNVKMMVAKEFGLSLDVETMNGNTLKSSLLELMNNPKYKKNIERLSLISKDQPMGGKEKAVWWIEYLLRHGTTNHLRSPSADIPLFQYFFIDILAFLFGVFISALLILYVLCKLISKIFRSVFSGRIKFKVN